MLRGARSHSVVQPPVFKYKSKVTKNILFCWLIKNNLLAFNIIAPSALRPDMPAMPAARQQKY